MHRHVFSALLVVALALAAGSVEAAWTQQHEIFGNGNTLIAVGAGTGKHAVAYGQSSQMGQSKPLLLVTKDGETWTTAAVPSDFFMLGSISMVDEKFVYAGGLGLFKSTTGGSSFQEVKLPGGGGFLDMIVLNRVQAIDPNHVWAVADKKVYWTPNSLNWEVTEATVDDVSLTALCFATSQIGWVGGGKVEEITETDWDGNEKVVGYDIKPKGIVLQTTDGGQSFVPLVIGANETFRHLTFVDQNIGWAVASSNDEPWYLKKTMDGGKTWKEQPLPAAPEGMEWMWLSKIVFPTPLEGWAAGTIAWPDSELDNMGNKAVILHTADGGASWELDPEGESKGGYLDIDFAGKHWGYAVGTFAHIMAFTDGTEWTPPDAPGEDVVEQPGDDLVAEADVMSWGNVFGVFGDDVLIGENSYPGGGGPINAGTDDPTCTTQTQSTGCSASGAPASAGLLPVLLALLLLLRGRGRRVGESGAHGRGRRVAGLLVLLLVASCGTEKEVEVCKGPDLPTLAPPAGDVAEDDGQAMADFHCGLQAGDVPLVFGATEARRADINDFIVFVKQHDDGGSDLYIAGSDGKNAVPLTEFNDPDVHVYNPSWAPDRKAIAFVSDYRSAFNDKGQNVFVIALDRSVCYQLTPEVEGARNVGEAAATATVNGVFRYGQGAIASPVADALVAWPGAEEAVTTGAGGEFSVAVPPGKGTLVMRGTVNGMQVKGLAAYEAEAGQVTELDPTIGFIEAEYTIARLHWSPSGALLFAFVSEQLDALTAVDTATGEGTPFMADAEDRVVVFAPFPDAALAVVAFNSDPQQYYVHTLTDAPEAVREFLFEGQTAESLVTVSPMRFLATIQQDSLLLLGADGAGELATVDITPDNLSGLVPGQLDWSPAGGTLVVTVNAGGKTNLMLVDVNERTAKAITTDGKSSMPAWYGM